MFSYPVIGPKSNRFRYEEVKASVPVNEEGYIHEEVYDAQSIRVVSPALFLIKELDEAMDS